MAPLVPAQLAAANIAGVCSSFSIVFTLSRSHLWVCSASCARSTARGRARFTSKFKSRNHGYGRCVYRHTGIVRSPNYGKSVLDCVEPDFCNEKLCRILQALRDWHAFAFLQSCLEATKSALSEHQPGEEHCTGEKTSEPDRRGGVWKKSTGPN